MRWCSRLVLIMAGYYVFFIICFYANGLGYYSYAAIGAQQTPDATDFPFSSPSVYPFGMALWVGAALVDGIGQLLLPLSVLVLGVGVGVQWRDTRRRDRQRWMLVMAFGLLITAIMWSPLGLAIGMWILD